MGSLLLPFLIAYTSGVSTHQRLLLHLFPMLMVMAESYRCIYG